MLKNKNITQTMGLAFHDGTIFETILNPETNQINFVVDDQDGRSIKDKYEYKGVTYQPPSNSTVGRTMKLPSGPKSYLSGVKLHEDIKNFLRKYLDIEEPFLDIMARYIMMSWVYEAFRKVPIIRFLGPCNTGKSQALTLMNMLVFRPILTSASTTSAILFRQQNKIRGTLIIDEANFEKSGLDTPITQILNSGYEKNGVVRRCNQKDYDQVEEYSTFGPKVLACRRQFDDEALESRCLTCVTKTTNRKDIPSLDLAEIEALPIQDRLLDFRLSCWNTIQNAAEVKGIDHFDPRMREIIKPLFQVMGENEVSDRMLFYLNDMYDERLSDLQGTEEALVAKTVVELSQLGNTVVTVGDVAWRLEKEHDYNKLTARKVGSILSILGLKKKKTSRGYVIELTEANIKPMKARFKF